MARRMRYIASGLAAIILMPVATHLAHSKSDDYADAATVASQQYNAKKQKKMCIYQINFQGASSLKQPTEQTFSLPNGETPQSSE